MAHGGRNEPVARERVLLVAPVGAVPWAPMVEIAAASRAAGYDVLIDDAGHDASLVPRPPSGAFAGSIYGHLRGVIAVIRWWRTARAALREAGVTQIVVWEQSLAGLTRLVRPRSVQLSWVIPDYATVTRRDRWLRAATLAVTDRIIVSRSNATRLFPRRHKLVPSPRRAPIDGMAPDGDAWVALIGLKAPDEAAWAALEAQARAQPARAVVIDGRRGDTPSAEIVDRARMASGASDVIYAIADEWAAGLALRRAIDIGPEVVDDHRHWGLLATGSTILVAPSASWWALDPRLVRATRADGWHVLSLDVPAATGAVVVTVEDWCRAVLAVAR